MNYFSEFNIINAVISAANFLASLINTSINFSVAETARLVGFLESVFKGSLADLSRDIESRDGDILAFLADRTGEVEDLVGVSENRVREAILAAQLVAQQTSERSDAVVIAALTGVLDREADEINRNTDRGVGSILDSLSHNSGTLDSLSRVVQDEVTSWGDLAVDILEVLGQGINTTILNTIQIDEGVFGTVLENVRGALKDSQEQNAGIIDTVMNIMGSLVDDSIRIVGDELGELHPELRRIWMAIVDQGEKARGVAAEVRTRNATGTGGAVTSSALEEIQKRVESTVGDLRKGLVDFVQDNTQECLAGTEVDTLAGDLKTGLGFLDSLVLWVLRHMGGLMAFAGFTSAQARDFVFQWSECYPWNRLPPSETVLSFQRGLLSAEDTQRTLQQHGWNAEDAERIVNTGFTVPDLNIIYALWLRDLVDDDALEQLLADLGYPEGMRAPIKELAFFIPPVQDLITMAVREVFTPEIAEAQGQFEDFPEAFASWARKQGVSEEWARNYWAAHWSLPSVQMGFEMLHRGVIDEEQLNTLLRALDIMPGWREPLTQISYTPFTRVDIRRMHRLGVLDEGEVLRSYKDIGYDDEKARTQLEFVLAANKEDELVTLDVASDLTRSSILGFYADGIINRGTAFALLTQAGINVAASELFLLGADFDIERRDRGEQVTLILDRFRFVGQSLNESADQIRALGLETRERQLALLELERLSQMETKLPSKADLDKFLKAGIIPPTEYIDQLERQGFSPMWAGRYLELQAGEGA